jgi:hypothetical protein
LFLACCAAFVLAYAISLRPQEYLKLPRPVPLRYTANSSLSHFVFDGVFYSVCYPALFPPGSPSHFTTLLEFQKNDTRGKGGPKAIAHCSSVPMSYNCLSVLFNFLRRYPPLPNFLIRLYYLVSALNCLLMFSLHSSTSLLISLVLIVLKLFCF